MGDFRVPPYKGEEHFDLGIWHPSALTADMQNKEAYYELERRLEEDDWCEVVTLVDALPDEETDSRSWSIVLRCNPLYNLISLWPTVAIEIAPAIVDSAKRHGLVCHDPQNDVVTLPPT